MENAHKIYIQNLRKKSRSLLEHLKKNSQIIENKINKLHSQNSSKTSKHQIQIREYHPVISRSWKIRNDSTSVGGLLCPDIYCPSARENPNELGNMTVGGRILITSKQPAESLPFRKPIKGCYCNHELKKIQYRSPRTIYKPDWPCDYCKSNFDIHLPSSQPDEQDSLSPTLSCKTLQKVQRINYTPRSEFLRRVQKKVSQQYNICSDYSSEPVVPSSRLNKNVCCDNNQNDDITLNKLPEINYQRCVRETDALTHSKDKKLSKTLRIAQSDNDFMKTSDNCLCESQTGLSGRRNVSRSKSKSREEKITHDSFFGERNVRVPEIQTIFPSCKRSKFRVPSSKTVSSCKRMNNVSAIETPSKSSLKVKKKSRVLSQKKSCCNNCCPVNERMKNSTNPSKKCHLSKCTKCCGCQSRLCPLFISPDDLIDHEAAELRKFREKNYYDTHGSRQTLLSSTQSSSGSLEQFTLNERLFPELVGKIHRNDLVVSMPICATKQFKRIHYFPRHIVKQQKNPPPPPMCHNKKGLHQSCPLTGHAVDLGLLKVSCPINNSLALKFQKGVV